MTSRSTDHGKLYAAWGRWGRDLTTLAAVALAAWSVTVTQSHVNDVQKQNDNLVAEGLARKDQTCLLFERQEMRAVDQLRNTYSFLAHPPKGGKSLVPLALAQLNKVKADAISAKAPSYCDAPGVGLPETNEPFPEPPPNLPTP